MADLTREPKLYFNPRPLMRGGDLARGDVGAHEEISIHAPSCEGATLLRVRVARVQRISIHAPSCEGAT